MRRVKNFFNDFKKFISRGSVVDLAVGVIVGSSFTAIVTSFSNKIIMPLINWLLSIGGGGLDSVYTFLKKEYDVNGVLDLTRSIYIDWGTFISAILNFFIIAFVLFMFVRTLMKSKGFLTKAVKQYPTRKERKILKAEGVDFKEYDDVIKATIELRKKSMPVPVVPKPTQEELLTSILAELQSLNKQQIDKSTKKLK